MNTTVETAATAVEKITNHGENMSVRRVTVADQLVHQGDVYLHRVPDTWERGKELGTRQVAVGTSVGSRHIIEGDGVAVYEGVKLPDYVDLSPEMVSEDLLGPVVVITEKALLTHPEHAHHQFSQAGTWQVTYQWDFGTRKRVSD